MIFRRKPESEKSVSEKTVLDKLATITMPDGRDIVAAGMVEGVHLSKDVAIISLTVPAEQAQAMEPLRAVAEKSVSQLPGIAKASVILTAERKAGSATPRPAAPAGARRRCASSHKPPAFCRMKSMSASDRRFRQAEARSRLARLWLC